MTASDIHATLGELLSRVLEREVTPPADAMLVDLGCDSVRVVELVAELEDRFDITVPLDQIARIRTVGEVVDHVHAALAARAG
jgi:acyl carrier protein